MHRRPQSIVTVVCLVVLAASFALGLKTRTVDVDFIAFVCGGEAVRERANPYAMQPLSACERRRLTELRRPELAEVVTPCPLPVYALAPFALLSFLTTKIALLLWDAILLACMALGAMLLRRMTALPYAAIGAELFVGVVFVSLAEGQIVPLIIGAAILAAWAVDRKRDTVAAIGAAVTMFEPNLGLPLCIALFFMRPAARLPLVVCGAVLAALSFALAPAVEIADYFRVVLPAHAASEVHNDQQLTITHLAALAHVPDRIALSIGSLSYAILVVAGTLAAVRAERSDGRRGIALILAPAVAILGGTFAHVQQFTIVGVLALLAASAATAPPLALRLGLLGAALPLIACDSLVDVAMYVGIAGLIAARFFGDSVKNMAIAIGCALAASAGAYEIFRKVRHETPEQTARLHADIAAATAHARLPEDVWRVFMNEHVFTLLGWNAMLLDVPLIVATVAIIAEVVRGSRRLASRT